VKPAASSTNFGRRTWASGSIRAEIYGNGLPTGPSALWTEKDDRTLGLALAIFDAPRRLSEPHS
jgi:hypothetical protein